LCNSSLANYQSLCPKCVPHTWRQWFRCNATRWPQNQASTDQTAFTHKTMIKMVLCTIITQIS